MALPKCGASVQPPGSLSKVMSCRRMNAGQSIAGSGAARIMTDVWSIAARITRIRPSPPQRRRCGLMAMATLSDLPSATSRALIRVWHRPSSGPSTNRWQWSSGFVDGGPSDDQRISTSAFSQIQHPLDQTECRGDFVGRKAARNRTWPPKTATPTLPR